MHKLAQEHQALQKTYGFPNHNINDRKAFNFSLMEHILHSHQNEHNFYKDLVQICIWIKPSFQLYIYSILSVWKIF